MPPASSGVTTASSMSSSEDDISLPPSPSPSLEASPDPYAFSSLDEITSAPPAKKKRPPNRCGTAGWPTADEVVLLEAVAAHKEQHGSGLPTRADLPAALAGRLPHVSTEQAAARLSILRERYHDSVRKLRRGTVPVTDDGLRVFRLSKRIWEGVPRREPKPRPAPRRQLKVDAGQEELRNLVAKTIFEEME